MADLYGRSTSMPFSAARIEDEQVALAHLRRDQQQYGFGEAYPDGRPTAPAYIHQSPSSNPHTGMHPSSFGQGIPYAAAALGATSSHASSSIGMSISPPHWIPGNAPWTSSGSYVGSLGALGTSFGRERDRELEAKYVRDFSCCGRQLNGLHELLEHYEEEHANLPPDARMAAINAAQVVSPNRGGHEQLSHVPTISPIGQVAAFQHQSQHGEAPTPPGMMDIEMDDPLPMTAPMPANFLHAQLSTPSRPSGFSASAPPSPWATAFRPQGNNTPPQCLPPSLLSFNPSGLGPSGGNLPLSVDQLQARAMKKAQKKAERAAVHEEASASDVEGEKRFPCPIEGCGKVYKQANGLKYHLTRSINSGHGNVAAMGGLASYLGDKPFES